jgi:hypothetical protein
MTFFFQNNNLDFYYSIVNPILIKKNNAKKSIWIEILTILLINHLYNVHGYVVIDHVLSWFVEIS